MISTYIPDICVYLAAITNLYAFPSVRATGNTNIRNICRNHKILPLNLIFLKFAIDF